MRSEKSKYPYIAELVCTYCGTKKRVLITYYDQTRRLYFCSADCKHQHRRVASSKGRGATSFDHTKPERVAKNQSKKRPSTEMSEYVRQLRLSYGLEV